MVKYNQHPALFSIRIVYYEYTMSILLVTTGGYQIMP
jgi:hypothetical protein